MTAEAPTTTQRHVTDEPRRRCGDQSTNHSRGAEPGYTLVVSLYPSNVTARVQMTYSLVSSELDSMATRCFTQGSAVRFSNSAASSKSPAGNRLGSTSSSQSKVRRSPTVWRCAQWHHRMNRQPRLTDRLFVVRVRLEGRHNRDGLACNAAYLTAKDTQERLGAQWREQ